MIGDVLSVGDGHQGWRTKLSIKKELELPSCPKTGAMTFKTVLDKGYSLDPVLRLPTSDSRLQTSGCCLDNSHFVFMIFYPICSQKSDNSQIPLTPAANGGIV